MEKRSGKAWLMVRIASGIYMLLGIYNLINCFFDWQDLRYIPIYTVVILCSAMLRRLKNPWRIIALIDSIAGICFMGIAILLYHLVPEVKAEMDLELTQFEVWQMTYDMPVQIILNVFISAVLLSKPVKKLFVAGE